MTEPLFLNSHNPVSDRFVILDEMEKVAYIYLTEKGTQKPEKDAVAYMRITPPETVDWNEMAKNGEPPILSSDLSSDLAVIKNSNEKQFDFLWSNDGESVALIYKNSPIAFISYSEKIGYSKSVSKNNNLTNPWDDKLYDQLFIEDCT